MAPGSDGACCWLRGFVFIDQPVPEDLETAWGPSCGEPNLTSEAVQGIGTACLKRKLYPYSMHMFPVVLNGDSVPMKKRNDGKSPQPDF